VELCHLCGLNHFLQNVQPTCWTPAGCADEAEQKAALRYTLEDIISASHPDLIAEEAKPGQLNLGAVLAEEHRAAYSDITMPLVEREKCGIRTPGYNRAPRTRAQAYREFERYMFERIASHTPSVSLVICGRHHMRPLEQRFIDVDVTVFVYDIYDYAWYRGVPQEDGVNVIGYEREDEGD
jgi:hypothetical protein